MSSTNISQHINISSINLIYLLRKYLNYQGHIKLSTRFVLNVYSSRSFLLHQLPCSLIGLKQREMEMEEGLARVSWYKSQLLIGPNNFFSSTSLHRGGLWEVWFGFS